MKKIKLLILICIILIPIILISLYYIFRPQSIPILAYHDFDYEKNIINNEESMFVDSIEKFEKQMKYIYEKGYKTLSMEEFYNWKKGKIKLPRKSVLITFDDGSKSIYELVYPIMKKYNLKGTSFIIGSYTSLELTNSSNYLSLSQIKEIQQNYPNFEFHSHTYGLHSKKDGKHLVTLTNENELLEDIEKMNNLINTEYNAYPFGHHTEQFISLLKKSNYKLGFIYYAPFIRATRKHDDFKIPRVTIDRNIQFWRFKMALLIGLPSRTNIIPK